VGRGSANVRYAGRPGLPRVRPTPQRPSRSRGEPTRDPPPSPDAEPDDCAGPCDAGAEPATRAAGTNDRHAPAPPTRRPRNTDPDSRARGRPPVRTTT